MPGPVSDSYDPEFGTSSNADEVMEAVRGVRDKISAAIGSEQLRDILEVVRSDDRTARTVKLTDRQLRVIRFAMNRALESL